MTSDKSYTTEQRLTALLNDPSIVALRQQLGCFNSANQTGISGTDQGIGTVSTGVPLLPGTVYWVHSAYDYTSATANIIQGAVFAVSGTNPAMIRIRGSHWHEGGNTTANSFGSGTGLPFTFFGPTTGAAGQVYQFQMDGLMQTSTLPPAGNLQLTITSNTAPSEVFAGAYVMAIPLT